MARSETATPVRRPRRGATALMLTALLAFTNVPPAFAASAPAVGAIVGPVEPVPVGTAVSATSTFVDPDSATHTAMWSWGDGTTSAGVVAYAGGSGTVNGSHAYTQPGVYRLGLQVIDETGATGSAVFDYVVVYDSSGGFVTGGGWINSPPGAYPANPSLVGRANFGLVAKYQNGTSAPQGTTEFQFHAADFNFHSLDYEWLVVAGARAQYRGTGEIHGRSGTVRFFVTAIDGDLLGGDHPDLFRIKVFDAGGVIYDNQQGASDDADPVMALGGGQIVIHKSKDTKPVNQPPIANAGPDQTVIPGTAITLNGSASSDPDGDALTFAWTLMSKPAGSAAALTGSTTVTPHFTADIAGVYVIRLVVNDGSASSAPDQVSVTATAPVNHAPIAANDAYTTNEDTTLTVPAAGVLGNDTDVDGPSLSAILVSGPAHGSLALNADGSFTYTPTADYNGPDSFSYTANDGSADSNIATVHITINPVNDAPVAYDDAFTTNEDTPLTVPAAGVLGNDSDIDGPNLSSVLVSGPAHGSLALNSDGSFTYTPEGNYNGSDSFTYKANDGLADSDIATAHISINPVNDAPVAHADIATVTEDASVLLNVRANDTDVDGDALSIASLSGAKSALGASISIESGQIRYTADADSFDLLAPGATVADSFAYTAADGHGGFSTATVNLTITGDQNNTVVNLGNGDHTFVDVTGGRDTTVYGGNGADTIFGGDGADVLYGQNGADILNGGNGIDLLFGGQDNDRLTGGAGSDTFVFQKSGGDDTITDFQIGIDHVRLDDGLTVKSVTALDVDHTGSLDAVLQLSNGSVTLLNTGAITDWHLLL